MLTSTLKPLQSRLHTGRHASVKIIASLLVLTYGAFNFSAHSWVLLSILVLAIIAISDRISRINSHHNSEASTNKRVNTDGGSFRQAETTAPRNAYPVVQDGGNFRSKR